jgi:hypothetical protein
MDNNTLPPELQEEIEQQALKLYPLSGRYYEGSPIDYNNEVRDVWIAGATEYASKLHLLQQELDGYKEWAEDYKLLVREIAIALHGDDAAKQPSLCDLVGPVQKLAAEFAALQQEYKALQRWQQEAKLVLYPILEYGQFHTDMKLGQSISTFVIERCKQYDELKAENERLHSSFDNLMTAHERLQKEKLQNEAGITETWRKKDAEHAALKEKADKIRLALVMAVFALKISYDVVEHPADGTSEQDSAIRIGEEALSSYNSNTNNQNENNADRD